MKFSLIHILILILFLSSASCSDPEKKKPEIEKGFLDLSSWNFEKDGLVDLNGQWEFYWEKLLNPSDFESNVSFGAEYINVPKGWAKQEEKSYPELGYATYRLKIKVPDKDKDYNFIFMSIFASAKLWVNGTLCFEKGKVASTKEQSKPEFITDFYTPIKYDDKKDTLDIIVQIADFDYGGPAAGIRRKVTFGPVAQINTEAIKISSLKSSQLGILLLIILYHIFLYAYRRNEPSYLVFALLGIVAACWTIYSSGIFSESFTYRGYFLIGETGPALFPSLLVLFYYTIYKDEVHKIVVYAFLIISLIFMTIYLMSSTIMMSKILTIFTLNMLIPPSYLLGYSLIKAVLRRRSGAVLSYLGVLIMLASVMHDAFLTNGFIVGFGNYISTQGFMALIIIQSLVLAQLFSQTFQKNINLNLNLEKIVAERTRTIDEQRSTLEQQNLGLLAHKKEIQEQNEILKQRNEEITYSLNYAMRIQSAMLPPESYISELIRDNFILYKPKDIVSGDFYWIKHLNQYVIVVVADCTGHGVPGAFMSILGIDYLNEIVQRREVTQANMVLNELRKQIKNSLRQHGERDEPKDGIDMALCSFDLKELRMQYAGANNPLYLIRGVGLEAKLMEYKADPMPIGYYNGIEKPFTNHEIKLMHGDTIYMFSDGYWDQKGGKNNRKYMISQFKNLLLGIQDETMHNQKLILENKFINWMGDNPQVDDVLVVGMRI
jgi:serine phosphatase RsbU (regulator of sigma subunit)